MFNFFKIAKRRNLRNMKNFFTLLQKSLRRKWRKLCTVSMSSFVTVGHVKLISQEAGLLASPLLPPLVVRRQILSAQKI